MAILMLGYPMLYHDMEQRLMISFVAGPQAGMPSMPAFVGDYRMRVVRSLNHLVEKILVFDGALDDRAIEVVKVEVCHALIASYGSVLEKFNALPLNASHLLFVGQAAEKLVFLLLLEEQARMPVFVQVAVASYADAIIRLDKIPEARLESNKWHAVNFEWARRIVKSDGVPLSVELIVAPGLLEALPAAASLWQKHMELVAKP
jgi:hypothetical protein